MLRKCEFVLNTFGETFWNVLYLSTVTTAKMFNLFVLVSILLTFCQSTSSTLFLGLLPHSLSISNSMLWLLEPN